MTEEEVRLNYRSTVTKKTDYHVQLRCQINTEGTHAVNCWDMARERTAPPADLRETELVCKLQLS